MNRETVKQHLVGGGSANYEFWYATERFVNCPDGCCEVWYDDVEETLDNLAILCNENWEEVELG